MTRTWRVLELGQPGSAATWVSVVLTRVGARDRGARFETSAVGKMNRQEDTTMEKRQTKGIVTGVAIVGEGPDGEMAEVTILVAAEDAPVYGERIGHELLVTTEVASKLRPVRS